MYLHCPCKITFQNLLFGVKVLFGIQFPNVLLHIARQMYGLILAEKIFYLILKVFGRMHSQASCSTLVLFVTHIFRMDFPLIIIWTSPISILGESGLFFHFYFNFYRNSCKQTNRVDPDETQRSVGSHLVLYCLPMSQK